MPPAKTARKTTKKTVRPTVKKVARTARKRPGPRTMSAAHKKALAEGRTMSATVDRYLVAINTPRKRGRKISRSTLEQRLADARLRVRSASGTDKVLAAQAVRDLQARLIRANGATDIDVKAMETAFVKVAKKFGENRGIGYGAWRDAGVSAEVLRKAGVARTRG